MTDPLNVSLRRDSRGRLVLTDADGREHVGVEPVRAFPMSDPDHWISLCDADAREVLSIDDLNNLPQPARNLVREELNLLEFLPVISKIIKISGTSDPSEWCVETDRGETCFILNDEEDIHRLAAHRILIIDAYGIRYLIPDTRKLDTTSRRLLGHFI